MVMSWLKGWSDEVVCGYPAAHLPAGHRWSGEPLTYRAWLDVRRLSIWDHNGPGDWELGIARLWNVGIFSRVDGRVDQNAGKRVAVFGRRVVERRPDGSPRVTEPEPFTDPWYAGIARGDVVWQLDALRLERLLDHVGGGREGRRAPPALAGSGGGAQPERRPRALHHR